jgi:hypothetical protein
MPPGGPKLEDAEIELIRKWMEGPQIRAKPPRHHGEGPPPLGAAATSVVPHVRAAIRSMRLSRCSGRGLAMNPRQIMRLCSAALPDLTGLPPSREDPKIPPRRLRARYGPAAFSPRYGERWARHWLDIAGYADSEGVLDADVVRPNAWRYRDYVIRAFNNDKPYDQFVREQIAGDEIGEYWKHDALPGDVVDKLEATGFLRTAVDATRDDFLPKDFAEYQWRTLFDTEQILVSSFLGLTIQCSRCHDHKYEPITQRDYYSVQAVLASAIRPTGPVLPTYKRFVFEAPKAEQQRAEENNKPLEAVTKALRDLQAARRLQFRNQHPKKEKATDEELRAAFPDFAAKFDAAAKELTETNAKMINLPTIRMLNDIDAEPRAADPCLAARRSTEPGRHG